MRYLTFVSLLVLLRTLPAADTGVSSAAQPSAEQIVERMRVADLDRASQLEGYTATRVYRLLNPRFNRRAQITARITYTTPGEKRFEILSEEGSRIICDRVLRRVIAAESDTSIGGNRDLARINLVNYYLRVVGIETNDSGSYYVLELEPRSKSPYLVKGRAWIDSSEYALARLEGTVAKKPSVWVGSPVVRQTYVITGAFWLPDKNLSTTDAPIFGKTDLAIETSSYQIRSTPVTGALTERVGN